MVNKSNDPDHSAHQESIRVNVEFRGAGEEKAPSARAYLFDLNGRLVASQPLEGKALTFPVNEGQKYRVRVGPDLLKDSKVAPANLAAQLDQTKAFSQDYIPAIHGGNLSLGINQQFWSCWFFPTCINVHGTVRKLLNPDSTQAVYASICQGTVQIFQVDLACTLDLLAPPFLFKLRDRIVERLTLQAQQGPGIINPGDSGPERVINKVSQARLSQMGAGMAQSQAFAASHATVSANALIGGFNRASSLSEAAITLRNLDAANLKQYLVLNRALLFWLWCEFIPDSAFCWQELTEVLIQSDGSFSAEVCFWCPEDFPDLYFEVVQNITGTEREIYDPQIACSTYYNYDGSRSVDIVVDDPKAIACPPINPGPNHFYVWPNYIGWEDLWYVKGLTDGVGPGVGLLPGRTPWGGTLQIKTQMHPDLPTPGISYFRWSYKFPSDPDFTHIKDTFTIRKQKTTYIAPATVIIQNTPVTFVPEVVGPSTDLFAIPEHLPPDTQWIDFPYGNFDSTLGAVLPPGSDCRLGLLPGQSGLCTLKLEMFDSGGNPVASDNLGGPATFAYLLADQSLPVGAYTNAPAYNIDGAGNLTFQIVVDNNHTVAQLPKVKTPVSSTDTDPCGILHYSNGSDEVDIYYVAFHLNDYLDWSLGVSLGIMGTVVGIPHIPSTPLPITSEPPTDGSSGSPDSPADFGNSASALLQTCTQGAFAVDLNCYARATNGYSRQNQYDCSATIGFALLTLINGNS
jgi:hypothetical protein